VAGAEVIAHISAHLCRLAKAEKIEQCMRTMSEANPQGSPEPMPTR